MAKKAFILGINTLGLQYSEKDADLMASCLEPYGYEIHLSGGGKKKYQIREELDCVIDNCNKTDTVIFYFSGHGIVSRGKLKLVISNETSKNENLIDINEVIDSLETCLAINKAIILDCCHAGTAYAEWSPETSDSYRMLTASEKLERAKELEELKASFMTYQFSKALTDAALEIADGENKIHINALYEYLRQRALDHNRISDSIKVPVPNLLGNLKSNFEIGTVLPKPKEIVEKEYDKDFVNNLVKQSRQLYLDGKLEDALSVIKEAYSLAPLNSDVIERYATILFRRLERETIWDMIRQYDASGKEKDVSLLLVEAEAFRREKKYREALKILLSIKDRQRYKVEYLTGISYLFLYGQDKKSADIMSALRHLRKANEYFPTHWYIKLNLAFTCMLCGSRDKDVENESIEMLNKNIQERPGQVSPKLYRLFYYALVDDFDKLVEVAEQDDMAISKQYELPIDFIDSTQDRLDLLYGSDAQKKEKYLAVFIKWATKFS